ncbi:MAG: response regulator transcription factor [Polyangiaceae bacterium]|nr:response regulator transcription factor [Myxococcales bacterium]MCB9584222.1 response regulator transcription factor [Polyangiaceae bacterium]MCB9608615.1 response regulator transcription factor [Polyangiaceae bacterium]
MNALDQRVRVVLVDDFPPVVMRMRRLLEAAGLDVVGVFHDGLSAIHAIPGLKPDVVVLDIAMPGMNGIDVLKAIRRAHIRCRVVMLTAEPEDEIRQQCLALGADAFLRKDRDFERVPAWILAEPAGPAD